MDGYEWKYVIWDTATVGWAALGTLARNPGPLWPPPPGHSEGRRVEENWRLSLNHTVIFHLPLSPPPTPSIGRVLTRVWSREPGRT